MARWPNKVPAFRSAPHRGLTQNRKRKANGPQAFRNAYRKPTYAGHPLGSVMLRRQKQAGANSRPRSGPAVHSHYPQRLPGQLKSNATEAAEGGLFGSTSCAAQTWPVSMSEHRLADRARNSGTIRPSRSPKRSSGSPTSSVNFPLSAPEVNERRSTRRAPDGSSSNFEHTARRAGRRETGNRYGGSSEKPLAIPPKGVAVPHNNRCASRCKKG